MTHYFPKAWKPYLLVIRPTLAKSLFKKIRLAITGTSKFYGARQIVAEIGNEELLRMTLASGNHYSIGMFCMIDAGEQKIDWILDKD